MQESVSYVNVLIKIINFLPRSWLAKIGNSRFSSTIINQIRKKGFKKWYELDYGIKIYFDPTDPHLIDMINGRDPEKNVKEIFLANINSGSIIIDVGANIGDYTLIASKKVGDSGKIYSFEPLEETFSLLQRNIVLNQTKNCIAINKAIGEKNGISTLYKINASGTMGHLDSKLNEKDLLKHKEIQVTSIDDIVKSEQISQIDMIKIDVEGFEHEVLLGCQDSFKKNIIKKILCEVHFKYLESKGKDENTIFDMLQRNGFIIQEISKRTPNRVHILAKLR